MCIKLLRPSQEPCTEVLSMCSYRQRKQRLEVERSSCDGTVGSDTGLERWALSPGQWFPYLYRSPEHQPISRAAPLGSILER